MLYHKGQAEAAEDRYNELAANDETAAATAADALATTHRAAQRHASQAARIMGGQWSDIGHIYQVVVDKDGQAHIERVLRRANNGRLEETDAEFAAKLEKDLAASKKRQAARGKEVADENVEKATDDTKKDLENELKRERTRSRKRRGARNRVVTRKTKDAAVQRIRDRLKESREGTAFALPIPQLAGMLKDAAIVAGYHVEAGARQLADFSRAMVDG